MDYYEEDKQPKNHEWAATVSLTIGLVTVVGIIIAYLVKYFGHYLYGISIPLENGWADNAVVDGIINGLIQAMNSAMGAAGPVLEEFFISFFTAKFAWVFIGFAVFSFVFSLIGLKSSKNRSAISGMAISVIIIVYSWWLISQLAR